MNFIPNKNIKLRKIYNLCKPKNRIVLIEGSYILNVINFQSRYIKIHARTLTFKKSFKKIFKPWFWFKSVHSYSDSYNLTERFQKKLMFSNALDYFLSLKFYTYSPTQRNKVLSEHSAFRSILKNHIYLANFGCKATLQVTGYFRRAWIIPNKKLLCLKVGKSFLSKITIPNKLSISVVKRRLIKICSSSQRLLIKFTKSVYLLRPADPYRAEGIRASIFHTNKKERFINKKR